MLLLNGDCIEEMQKLIDDGVQVDSVVTDPPYHLTSIVDRFSKTSLDDDTKTSQRARDRSDGYGRLSATGFMGKEWDGGDIAFRKETWELAYKVYIYIRMQGKTSVATKAATELPLQSASAPILQKPSNTWPQGIIQDIK